MIIDSSVWIEYLRGNRCPETVWLEERIQQVRLALTDLILCEVLQGTPDADFVKVKAALTNFKIFSNCNVDLALAAASNYRLLRKRAYTIRATVDCLIATFCLEHNHTLLHRDRDFDAFEAVLGLNVVHP